jgi:mannitol/fructose-specific phosphotransferase system IIA component
MLVDGGYVTERYVEGMLARDRELSTAIGNHIAIPHGTNDYKQYIKSTGIVVVTYPEGISWNGTVVHLVIGIAAIGEAHLDILGNVVDNLETEEDVLHLVEHGDMETIRAVFYDKGETSP